MAQRKERIYSFRSYPTLIAGATQTSNFSIVAAQRQMKLIDILITRELYNVGANLLIPLESNTTQSMYLRVGDAGTNYNGIFTLTGGTALTSQGNYIELLQAGYYPLNWDVFYNAINFTLVMNNHDGAITVNHRVNCSIRVEEEIQYLSY